jgi:hypothetical protein
MGLVRAVLNGPRSGEFGGGLSTLGSTVVLVWLTMGEFSLVRVATTEVEVAQWARLLE